MPTPSVVGTSTINNATIVSKQRKSFYANGLFWVFYATGSYFVYRTSADGTSWSSENQLVSSTYDGGNFDVWFDGTYMHIVYNTGGWGNVLYYRRGIPNSDGTITWSANWQTALASESGYFKCIEKVIVDSSGYPYIIYRRDYNSAPSYPRYPWVTKSSTNDGTWSTASGYPLQLSTTSGVWRCLLVPLTNNKVFAFYALDGQTIKGKLYDGSTWGSEETCTSSTVKDLYFSAVAEGDNIHLVFLKYTSPYDIVYVKRTYGSGWGSETTVQSSTTSTSAPVLSINQANGDLYCFWAGSPTANNIYYKKCAGGTWDSSPTDWISETETLTANDRLTGYYQAYSNYIGLVYMTKTASPFNVKFAYLTLAVGQVYEVNVDAICQTLSTLNYETTYNILKDATVASQSLKAQETTFNFTKDAVVNVLADVLVEVVMGIIEIFKEAIAAAQAPCQTEATFNISRDAPARALAEALFELGLAKEAVVEASTAGVYEVAFMLPLHAIVEADAFSVLEATFNISPDATVKVQAELTVVKPTEVRVTKLFLVIGDLAIQIQGN